MTIGEKIRRIRKFRHMKQRELAVAIGLDEKSVSRIGQYEIGYRIPQKETLEQISRALNVNILNFVDSGTGSIEDLMMMLFWMELGKIDLVITKSISRFSRNTTDCLKYIRLLKEKNIPVFFEKENINTLDAKGEILLTIMASLAQQESQSLNQNVKLGLQFRYQNGQVINNMDSFSRKEQLGRVTQLHDFIKSQNHLLTEFDEDIVKKWIAQITVWSDHFTVEFKSGVQVEIEG